MTDITQTSFGFLGDRVDAPKNSAPATPKKNTFTPPNLENGLSKGMCQDHAMLWIRMLAKQAKAAPQNFITQQMCEISFKRSEYDQVTVVRSALVSQLVK